MTKQSRWETAGQPSQYDSIKKIDAFFFLGGGGGGGGGGARWCTQWWGAHQPIRILLDRHMGSISPTGIITDLCAIM